MRKKAINLKNEITIIYYAYLNPKIRLFPKLIVFFTIGYILSPIDLIPDFIPVLGYLDDLIIVPALIALSLKLIQKEVLDESREKALKNPLTLKGNWVFALLFISIWVVLIVFVVLKITDILF